MFVFFFYYSGKINYSVNENCLLAIYHVINSSEQVSITREVPARRENISVCFFFLTFHLSIPFNVCWKNRGILVKYLTLLHQIESSIPRLDSLLNYSRKFLEFLTMYCLSLRIMNFLAIQYWNFGKACKISRRRKKDRCKVGFRKINEWRNFHECLKSKCLKI